MKYAIETLSGLVMVLAWLAGLVFVKGFWLTTAAVFFPPFAWYVLMERLIG